MIVDSSALISILRREPEAEAFTRLLDETDEIFCSAATYLETAIVVDSRRDPIANLTLDDLIARAGIMIEPFTAEQAQIARQAYRDYGRGSGHAANLNLGDCFAYALARVKRQPLLYKGDDFRHTDLRSAV
jgi:ribonuclease VapC